MTPTRIRIDLHGPFRLQDGSGTDRTPCGAKARAVLAVLARAPDHQCGRVYLRKLLWSDRADAQAAASLRQALTEIRNALGPHRDILGADRRTVRLCGEHVEVASKGAGAFLEDVDVRDPAFDAWKDAQEGPLGPAPRITTPIRLPRTVEGMAVLLEGEARTPEMALIEDFLIDAVGRGARENYRFSLVRKATGIATCALRGKVQCFRTQGGTTALRVALEAPGRGVVWSQIARLPLHGAPDPDDAALMALANQVLCRIGEALREGPPASGLTEADLLTDMAVADIFSVEAERLQRAERSLLQAIEIEPRGLHHGWLAQLYAFQYVERFVPLAELRERSEAACARAIELEPENSNVLAAVASSRLIIHRNLAASGELARLGIEANPANPLAWLSMSAALLYYRRTEDALAKAQRARHLAAGSRYRFWAEFQFALTSAVEKRTFDAIRGAELSNALNGRFRPPLRYLSAIYAGAGMPSEAAESFARLCVVEPDVTPEHFSDPDYPVSLMRKRGMLDTERLRDALVDVRG